MLTALLIVAAAWALAFVGAPLFVWTLAIGGALFALYGTGALGLTALAVALLIFAPVALILNLPPIRQKLISGPLVFGPFKA
ncbi:MAG: hypothetical protein ACREE7_17170, partial [Dongiaceae bacterium]